MRRGYNARRDAVLVEVRVAAPITAAEIAEATAIPAGTVRTILKRLEAGGLVESEKYQRRERVWMPIEEVGTHGA